ncbi:ribosomal protein S12 methylthiotransferase RimO [Bacteroidia bacterium]|nr:ribosomal protein S12 methylthiotransferase RimO [Bacteroidia bacterium]
MKKINIITLGCSKNIVDSERLAMQLQQGGYLLLHNSPQPARITIINTCGFINDAKEEAIDTILQCVQAKQRGEIEQLFVMGCLVQRYADALRKEIPEVDEYFGVNSFAAILQQLNAAQRDALHTQRLISTPQHYAYLKVAEGCNWHCGYCAIPLIRGKYVSTPLPDLLQEATSLAGQGVRELMLVAQDLTYYGLDLYHKRSIAPLVHSLSQIEGIEWLRLHYGYPTQFPRDLIDEMHDNPKVCKYLDIPFQHINDGVLQRMQRGHSQKDILNLIETLRRRCPDVALRTTLLVGYPNEDEAAFEELLRFVQDVRFERLGVFAYSEEDGTHAATHYADNVPAAEKQRRCDEVMRLQSRISAQLNEAKVGKTFRVIADRIEGKYTIARTQYDSPEVDGEVLIADTSLQAGAFYQVTITSANEFDLFGELRVEN